MYFCIEVKSIVHYRKWFSGTCFNYIRPRLIVRKTHSRILDFASDVKFEFPPENATFGTCIPQPGHFQPRLVLILEVLLNAVITLECLKSRVWSSNFPIFTPGPLHWRVFHTSQTAGGPGWVQTWGQAWRSTALWVYVKSTSSPVVMQMLSQRIV